MRRTMVPRALRNQLARVILDALHDARARRELEALAALGDDPEPGATTLPTLPEALLERDGWRPLERGFAVHAEAMRLRARRAWRVIGHRPLDPPDAPLGQALVAAARLFDAGLYYEVHEWLEPYWARATGGDREALQGLIQIAVGFEHLAGGNTRGARALIAAGSAKVRRRRLEGLDLDPFGWAARMCLDRFPAAGAGVVRDLDRKAVPRFPAIAGRRASTSDTTRRIVDSGR
jgi:hypothetical protein